MEFVVKLRAKQPTNPPWVRLALPANTWEIENALEQAGVQNAQKELELKQQLHKSLNSELAFRHLMQANKIPVTGIPNVQRAAQFYQLIRYSFGSACDSFGGPPVNIQNSLPLIDAVSKRLQSVVIFNRDFESLIRLRDGPDSFFCCDPPYFGTEDYYRNVSFTRADHEQLVGGCMYAELLIANYDMRERLRSLPEQLTFTV